MISYPFISHNYANFTYCHIPKNIAIKLVFHKIFCIHVLIQYIGVLTYLPLSRVPRAVTKLNSRAVQGVIIKIYTSIQWHFFFGLWDVLVGNREAAYPASMFASLKYIHKYIGVRIRMQHVVWGL